MNVRPHIAEDPAAHPRPSARVANIAQLLDCDPSDVRRLVRKGELEAHAKGKRGVRVFLDSVADYQARLRILPTAEKAIIHKPRAKAAASTAAMRSALAGLRAKGIV